MTGKAMSTDAVGVRESLTRNVRHLPTCALAAMRQFRTLPRPPYVSQDRNGRRERYARLRWYAPGAGRRAAYLGALTPKDEALLRGLIAERWPTTHRELVRKAHRIQAYRQHLRQRSHELAEACGYRFHGWMLRRRAK